MYEGLGVLAITAVSLGVIHTLTGPDHYIPFVAMAEARKWSLRKTILITLLSGVGHILSAVIIGLVGIMVGHSLEKLQIFDNIRGNFASWLMIAFGFVYLAYGIIKAVRNKTHRHTHLHFKSPAHFHDHAHNDEHAHVHAGEKRDISAWIIFTLLVFGPCEPLIPVLIIPTLKNSIFYTVIITGLFAVSTIITMLIAVSFLYLGVKNVFPERILRFNHAIAGGAILMSGLAVKYLGL